MKLKIGPYQWEPKHLDDLNHLKEKMGCFLKEKVSINHYKIDQSLEHEASRWFKESKFPQNFLNLEEVDEIIIEGDEIGFPFELLMENGIFLGQRYYLSRKTDIKYKINRNFKICYQFEKSDKAFIYYEALEKSFPIEILEPLSLDNISANIFHISGHFDNNFKERLIKNAVNPNVLVFFNSCCTISFCQHEFFKNLSHFILSYYEIPFDQPEAVESFPYFFYQYLLSGESIKTAFLNARIKYINLYGRITPLLFTLFASDPTTKIFITPFASHHKEIEKGIKNIEKSINKLTVKSKYPFFLFNERRGKEKKRKTLQSIINTNQENIWIQGEKAGIGKTTLLYQTFQLFKYGKFNGPIFMSFRDHLQLKRLNSSNFRKNLCNCLKFEESPQQVGRPGKKYLILIDGIEYNSFIYQHLEWFLDEINEIFGTSRVVVASRNFCPTDRFIVLPMEITPGDINAQHLRSSYNISGNIKLPEIPLVYSLFSRVKNNIAVSSSINKSQVISKYVKCHQDRIQMENPFTMMNETFIRFFSILAYLYFKSNSITQKQFIQQLNRFKELHSQQMDWWIFDKERKKYRDSESICELLLSTNIIINRNERLFFIHDSFFEYFLAYYFSWQGIKEIKEPDLDSLIYTEIPDFMKELTPSNIYIGNHCLIYLRLVLERLFYIRDYNGIETILSQKENQFFGQTEYLEELELSTDFQYQQEQLWHCLIRGCYFTRNLGAGIDEVKPFQLVNQLIHPKRLFNEIKLKSYKGRIFREILFTLLNILFDNNLMKEFFRLALFMESIHPTFEIYGLLSRGYLKINQLDKSHNYLLLKEKVLNTHINKEKHLIRLYAEKGLLFYYKFLSTQDNQDSQKGISFLNTAKEYYSKDQREWGNLLFTLRELLRFYLATKKSNEFEFILKIIEDIKTNVHPKNDYIPYLWGRKIIETNENVQDGIKKLFEAAGGFYKNQHFLEAAVMYLWVMFYCPYSNQNIKYIKEIDQLFRQLEEKQAQIKRFWYPFDEYLKDAYTISLPHFKDVIVQIKEFISENKDEIEAQYLYEILSQINLIS